jgi:hypothetical protein
VLALASLDKEFESFVSLMVQARDLQVVCLVFGELVAINQHVCESQVLNEQALFFVFVEVVPRDVDLQVMGRVAVALDFNPTNVIKAEVVLVDVYYSSDVLIN